MKYLSNYIEDGMSEVWKKHGVFFAFGKDQFNEQKKDGVKYYRVDGGMLCPQENFQAMEKDLVEVIKNGIAQDIAENGIDNIIKRELANHEAYYTGDIDSTWSALTDYEGITRGLVVAIFLEEKLTAEV